MPVDIAIRAEAPNGRGPKQVFHFAVGDQEHRETIDAADGFAREKAVQRIGRKFGLPVHKLSALDTAIVEAGEAAESGEGEEAPPFTKLFSGADLLALNLTPTFLVKGVVVQGQPMVVGGRSKVLKTSITIDLALSLGSGTPFLGRFETTRAAVGFWSGESGAATIRETARRIADSKGINLADVDSHWCFDLPRLSRADHLEQLQEVIRGEGLKVAIIDPLYLALLSRETASGASNLFAMGPELQGLTRLGQATGCTVILLHHFRKGGQPDEDNPAGLEELSQSGIAEWARQWLLLQRRTPYQANGRHELWMRAGGSAGHSSLWALDVDEGLIDPETFEGRHWEVSLSAATEARAQGKRDKEMRAAKDQERREGEHRARLLEVLRGYPNGETRTALSEACGINKANLGRAIYTLLQEGRVEECQVRKFGATHDGIKPT